MPQQNRALAGEPAEVLFRGGSQSGRVATHLAVDATQDQLDAAARDFIVGAISEFRTLRGSKQKNPARNLKKCLDRADVERIEAAVVAGDISDLELADSLL